MPAMTAQQFTDKWRTSALKETAAYIPHFEDLCRLIDHPTPTDADPGGTFFTYQRRNLKESGRLGFADVWRQDRFGWEYKNKGEDLEEAYRQLLQYRDNLANPPLLVVCDFDNIEVHTNFTGTVSETYRVTLDHIADSSLPVEGTKLTGIQVIRACFENPDTLKPGQTTEALTKEAAARFEYIAKSLRPTDKSARWGKTDEEVAKFLTRLIFCMFASDVGLLPPGIVTTMIQSSLAIPGPTPHLANSMSQLFDAMRTGGQYGPYPIQHFDGGLFSDNETLRLDGDILGELLRADALNWSQIEPSVFGTLFERILNPDKRSQLGAHYTSRTDIELIVEPVLMWPLHREWEQVQIEISTLLDGNGPEGASADAVAEATAKLASFLDRLGNTRVLDPACGSGNFLYVSLAMLKELEQQVIAYAAERHITDLPPKVHPRQLYGIEIDPYAHELASIVVWIGYLQWKWRNGVPFTTETPILQPLDNVQHRDAVLDLSDPDNPREPEWPDAEIIVGNPPFLGGKLLRRGLGDEYVDTLFNVWDGRVRRESDICCYWHEKARAMIEDGRVKRAGLLATQGIRGGANRVTLQRVKETGDIFFAESDRPWILDGATVHVSMVGFDDGSETRRQLDGQQVKEINANLTVGLDLTVARRLKENLGTCFQGPVIVGPFDIDDQARARFAAQSNPHGKPNTDVIRPLLNAWDLTHRARGMFIIDFQQMTIEQAALYEAPLEHVRKHVKPLRDKNRDRQRRLRWWHHGRAGTHLRQALVGKARQLVTPRVAKHRAFIWASPNTVVTDAVVAVARDDDYFFGVLHSRAHELWARGMGTQLREVESGFRYTPTTTFETFPFPRPTKEQELAIAEAARELNELRENWLNPLPDPKTGEPVADIELKKRTLTNLYNARPTWLDLAHSKLDRAVIDAYGWPHDISDEQILERLLALNLEREPAYPGSMSTRGWRFSGFGSKPMPRSWKASTIRSEKGVGTPTSRPRLAT